TLSVATIQRCNSLETLLATAPRSLRAAQNRSNCRVVPAMAAAVDAVRVERASDSPRSHALLSGLLDAGNDGLLLRVLDEPVRGRRIDAPTIRAAVGARHASAVRLVAEHGGGGALRDLLAFQLSQRRKQGEDEPAHGRACVDVLQEHRQVCTGRVDA